MHIQSIIVLLLVVCCMCISATIDCNSIHRACMACPRKNAKSIDINDVCRMRTKTRWIWRNQSQCDIQRISCQNPGQKLNCDNIARLAKMQPRPLVRPRA